MDLYELTMGCGFFKAGKADEQAFFYHSFRRYPFKGGYAIASGMAHLARVIEDFHFSQEDIDYLAELKGVNGKPLFYAEFIDYLANLKLSLDINSVREGSVVFPGEPMVCVRGSIIECQLIETLLCNIVNFETLIATKSKRVCLEAKARPVMEFGLRRAQGPAGGKWASRAAFVGGCASTSNVAAGQEFNIPVAGTHAHSWVMSFDNELTAFRKYAEYFPDNTVLLVDTYNIKQGIANAITVGLELKAEGHNLIGVRIDSGDLDYWSEYARKELDKAGLTDADVVLSNDLDEYLIAALLDEGAPVASFGVGTKLACAYGQPSLGGVYKLSALKKTVDSDWEGYIKLSESKKKRTIPGLLALRRYFDESGKYMGDMIYDSKKAPGDQQVIVDPMDSVRHKDLSAFDYADILEPLVVDGKSVIDIGPDAAKLAKLHAAESLSHLDSRNVRIANPHTYPVGIEQGLFVYRDSLIRAHR
ncbi:MAG: nicotinate phosphoribosyltransferase [Eggerthellaceae bacterium]|nr:nicotinate phosphoribosyltransferase [Eggerthellaceae bacterium]